MYWLRNYLAEICESLKTLFEELERRLRVCKSCGRNTFYGKSCMER